MEPTAPTSETLDVAQLEINGALGAMGNLLGHLFRAPFTPEQAAFFASLDPCDRSDFFMTNQRCSQGIALVRDHFAAEEQALQTASADFHRLFVGPLKLEAAPWSSVYMDLGSLFGPTALAVRNVFKRNGFEIPEGTHEPSDHICYELAFMGEMHRIAESGDPAAARHALEEGRAFLKDYLLPWSDRFLDRVASSARTGAYRGLAQLTQGYLELEREFFRVF